MRPPSSRSPNTRTSPSRSGCSDARRESICWRSTGSRDSPTRWATRLPGIASPCWIGSTRIWDASFDGEPEHPLLQRLARTVRECGLPEEPFRRLIEANRRDQGPVAYQTFDELLGYCALSANPVGELVLHVFGAASSELIELSDRVCTGLQLVEHWQDAAEDFRRGRVYLPAEDLSRFGVVPADLGSEHAQRRLRDLLAFEVERARGLLDEGAPLVGRLRGRARIAVAGYVGGGRANADAIVAAGYDVLPGAPRAGKGRRLWAVLRTYGAGR